MKKTLRLLCVAYRLMFMAAVTVLLSAVPSSALAETQAYARLADTTLTFYYNGNKGQSTADYSLNTGTDDPEWSSCNIRVTKVVFDESFKNCKPTTCCKWFCGMQNLSSIEGMENLNTSKVTNMSNMFYDCSSLTALDVSKFDVSKVEDMENMFAQCRKLSTLNLFNGNTSSLTDMTGMFMLCPALTSLDLSGFNTEKVTSMSWLFSQCTGLASINVSGFNTSKVTTMDNMFFCCSALTSLDLSGFDFTQVTNVSCMFKGCGKLAELKTGGFQSSAVEAMDEMFGNCESLLSLDLYGLNTQKVTDMSDLFFCCSDLIQINISAFNTENVTDMSEMFFGCTSLSMLDLSHFNTQNVTDMSAMFSSCKMLTALDLSNFNTQKVTDMGDMFSGCSGLETLNLSGFTTSEVTNMASMFYSCSMLTGLDVSRFNTAKVEDMSYMFDGCSLLKELDLTNFNTSNVKYMPDMFADCISLTTLDVSNFDTGNVCDMSSMFRKCRSLKELDLSSFNTASVEETMFEMFRDCIALTTIYVSDEFVANKGGILMFGDCQSLKGAISCATGSVFDTTYANYTDGYLTKKVGTNGSDILGATGSPLTIETLTIDDDKAFSLNEGEECRAATATYSREMSSAWGTLCLPFAIDAAAETNTCNFYSLQSIDAESVALAQIETGTIEAGTPVVIRKKDNSQTDIAVTATDAAVASAPVNSTSSDQLVGTFAGEVLTDNGYFIAKDKFFSVADYASAGVKVNPFRAYISASDTNRRAAALRIVADGSTTGVNAADAIDSLNDAATEYYDMNGRRINCLQKGANIVKTGNKTIKVTVK